MLQNLLSITKLNFVIRWWYIIFVLINDTLPMMTAEDTKDFYAELGANIRQARVDAFISQEQLAQHLDLTNASIANIEKGRQRVLIHTLLTICSVLNVDINKLLPPTRQTLPAHNASVGANFDMNSVDIVSINTDASTKEAVEKFISHIIKQS
ncbi:helix-turn-helix domain-containing protein [Chitinophaga filiformis]|uniref:Helix-turn-helix domain-containing protein n=1 Tax=Chitinophaga filiformis TaxID=104663 RepID=A0ABY4HWN3_CHIFI|nr:helix-turn-helix transcriptional regulator [Chitinophaga filiformis]UPK67947.1 helix-turn-helix domain-containing protein [Chitinophaga filiformis]